MQCLKLDTLPDDLTYEIIGHLLLPDIVRLRQVSKHFFRVTTDRTVWTDAYKASKLLRPPGPHPSQSAQYLEKALVTSYKLHCNWTSKSPCPVSHRTIPTSQLENATLKLALGRWLLLGDQRGVSCYDLDDAVAWDRPAAFYTAHAGYMELDCTAFEAGQNFVYVAISKQNVSSGIVRILKLHLRPSEVRFELFSKTSGPPVELLGGALKMVLSDHFLVITNQRYIRLLDIHTSRSYDLLDPHQKAEEVLGRAYHYRQYLLTATHLIVMHIALGHKVFFEAFLLPSPSGEPSEFDSPTPGLIRTHSGICPFAFTEAALLDAHTPSADADPGSGNLTLLVLKHQGMQLNTQICILDVSLVPGDGTSLDSIRVSTRHTLALDSVFWNTSLTAHAGLARAINVNAHFEVQAYTIDASGSDGSEVDVQLRKLVIENPARFHAMYHMAFCGLRGRVCLLKEGGKQHVEVLDYV